MNYSEIFVNNVSRLLKIKGKTITQLETYCDISKGYFSRFKKKKQNIGFNTVMKATEFFGMSLDEIMNYDFKNYEISEIDKQMEELRKKKVDILTGK